MAQPVRRVSSLEEIESILPPPSASSHHKSRITSKGTDGMRFTRRARAKSLDDAQQAMTRDYITHKGSIKASFTWTPDFQLLVWLQKKLSKIGHGREDYSLFLFHKKSKFRKTIKRIVRSRPFLIFMALMVFLNAIALCFYQPSKYQDFSSTNNLIAYITIVVIVIYVVEAGLRIIAYGLILHPKSYLRNTAYILDVFIILCGILYVSMNFDAHVPAEVFGSLMALKLVRILAVLKSVKFILKAFASSLPPVFYLIIMTLCVMVFFALIGMELFQGVLHGGCYANYTSPAGVDVTALVSEYPCAWDANELGITTGSHDCPAGSVCRFWEEGPNNGITSFDNFLLALLTVFQVLTLEGWSDIFYLYESAVGYTYAWLYFLVVIFLGSVLILNLWTGVLTSVFIGVSDRGNIRRLKESNRIDEDLRSYKDWMKRAAELDLPSEVGSVGRRPSLFFDSTWISSPHWDLDSEDEEEEEFTGGGWESREQGKGCRYCCKYVVNKSRRAVRLLITSRVFFWFGMVILALNLVFLMALHFTSPPWFIDFVYILNYLFTIIYILETILKLYGLGPRAYFTSYILIWEFVLTLVNLLDVLALVYIEEIRDIVSVSAVVNACRCMALIRIFKYTRYWKAMKQILNAMFQLFWLLLSLMAIMAIFLFVFTILGLRLFGERLSRVANVVPNFDNWYNSFLIVFQLLTTEDWPSVMHSCVGFWAHDLDGNLNRLGYFAAIYFVVAVWLGGFVLVTIFLAFAVDKLSEVRSLENDSLTQKEKREKEREAREEHIHALKCDEPQIRRRTIQMAMRYLSEYPAQRNRAVQKPRMNFLQQLSLPPERVLRRGASLIQPRPPRSYARTVSAPGMIDTPPTVLSPLEDQTDVESGSITRQPVHKVMQSNPLQLLRQNSEIVEHNSEFVAMQMRRREGGVDVSFPVPSEANIVSRKSSSTGSAAIVSQQPSVEGEASVFVYPPIFDLEKRQPSIVSSPASSTCSLSSDVVPKRLPYERTQSLPAESPNSSKPQDSLVSSTPGKGAPELEIVIEGTSESEEEKDRAGLQWQQSLDGTPKLLPHDHPSSLSQSQVASLKGVVSHRLDRESSLEVIQPIQVEDQQIRRRSSQIETASSRWQLRDKAQRLWKWIKDYLGTVQFDPAKELKKIPDHSAFFILSPDNRFRQLCFRLVCSTVFQTITYAFILLSSLLLTLEIPIGHSNQSLCLLQDTLVFWDLAVVVFFLIEMALKMTALGVFLHRGSYFRGFFNTVDFTVAVTSLVPILVYFSTTFGQPGGQQSCLAYSYELMSVALNVLRVFRVLRPLRAIRISGLYLVATGLLSSLKSIGSILFFDVLALTIFAVIGTQVFRGRFYQCTDPMMRIQEDCVGTYFRYPSGDLTCPVVEERVWLNSGLNFDNYGAAFLTLFVMLTAEGWQNVMYRVSNTMPSDDFVTMGPDPNEPTGEEAIYFLLYMLVMTFVLLNLFVGFVIVTFQEVGVKSFRETKLDRNQRNCLYFALTARPHRHFIPRLRVHQKLHDFVTHYIFKFVIFVAVVLNCILLSLLRNDASQQEKVIYYWINGVFTVFFALEAILKIIAFTPPNYFRNGWNTFEFLIALGSVLEIILQQTVSLTRNSSLPESYQYSRIASTFRVLRLLRMVPKVRLILWTVIKSLEIFPWVGLLLLVVYFFYAVIGMQVFGTIEIASVDRGSQITQYNNFANFPQALLVMIRVSTGENWQEVMLDCLGGQACHESSNSTVPCGSDFAYVFFPSFFFVSSILILNLFVAIIIDNFDYLVRDRSKLGDHQLGLFVKLWSLYDPEAKGTLPPDKVMDLFRRCNPPVGWGKLCTYARAHQKMMTLNMPLIDGQVTFNATLFALVRTSLKIHCEGCSNCATVCNRVLEEKLKILFPRLPQKKLQEVLAEGTMHTVREEYAARLIQVQWRRFALRRRKIIQMFTGGRKRVLKAGLRRLPDAGPDLSARRLSDFSLDLSVGNPESRRESESESDAVFSSERVGALFNPLEMTTGSRRSSVESNLEENYEIRHLGDGRVPLMHRLQTIEELPESDMPINTNEEEMEQSEADLQSELSYASAYSSPVDSLHDGADHFSETTV